MRSKKPFSAGKPTFVIFITLLLALAIVPTQAQARKFKVLHTFHGNDGDGPASQLVRDKAGNLYGTTISGGSSKCPTGGCGAAFKMDKTGELIWLHKFQGANGNEPFTGLLRNAAGNLYGTTIYGGKINNHVCSLGCGVVFKLDGSGKETVLHKFNGVKEWFPVGPLVEDPAGSLYGVVQNFGSVFKVDKTGKETVLYNFGCGSDGCDPATGVILDSAGNIYGTTFDGGLGSQCCGVVFKLDADGTETVLHTFEGPDGAGPSSPLLMDSGGNLYGMTSGGGNLDCQGGLGCGVVYKLSPNSNGTWAETVLYKFCSTSNCTDGKFPGGGALIQDAAGNLYGTAIEGGANAGCGGSGCGVVFELSTSGKETVLHNFTGGHDGGLPTGLTMDSARNLYGTAPAGGDTTCNPPTGCGTVFKLTP
jgi:uncharacterized repeat protein (TIGR03803 family)